MHTKRVIRRRRHVGSFVGLVFACLLAAAGPVFAHPLGNFSVNQYCRMTPGTNSLELLYVVDLAEIPTLQELAAGDSDLDGSASEDELDSIAARLADSAVPAISIVVDGQPVVLERTEIRRFLVPAAGGLNTLRIECDLRATLRPGGGVRQLSLDNHAFSDRLGWREIVLAPAPGVSVFDSNAFGGSASGELHAYPQESLAAPLDERAVHARFTAGVIPEGATPLKLRDGNVVVATRDAFANLIAVPELTPGVALFGLLVAALLGGLHAMSPGHGKTVVGAYLVGARGTVKHALFLGLTVTITHTAGVFALGLVTLFASRYILPERLFPLLTAISGALVVGIGLTMFARRFGAATGVAVDDHHHQHGPGGHSHAPPETDGSPVSWSSLLALGVSGGLLPCPSALVVLLSAIALHRVAYGLLLVLAFSAGLASALTAIGLVFVFAGKYLKMGSRSEQFAKWMPVVSALIISVVGGSILYGAFAQAGVSFIEAYHVIEAAAEDPTFEGLGILGILGLGLVFGLKHATEADHVIAVSTIVSEHRQIWKAAVVGLLWGTGHTASLILVGSVVLMLRISIPEHVASWLEFGVAVMIIALGMAAVVRVLRGRAGGHAHRHAHLGAEHTHVHFHDGASDGHDSASRTHVIRGFGLKPLVVGAVHGLAGSAALTLLVLTQIPSFGLGLLYLAVFGIGSIGGMLLMSGLVGIPFALSGSGLDRFHFALQGLAGAFSVLFGVWYAYTTGVIATLF